MKRNAKQRGSGGRLRLGLLLATAAAFLLVPASQALAEHGEPHLKLTILAEPGASAEVTDNANASYKGTPPIACNYPEGGPQEGVCENEMELLKHPFTGEKILWIVAMEAHLGPETFVDKWELVGGEVAGGCTGFELCTPETKNEAEDIEVKLYLGVPGPFLTLNLVGEEGGGGGVLSPGSGHPPNWSGTPPLDCDLPEGGTQEGVCETEMLYEYEEANWAVGMGVKLPGLPNSDFVEWEVGAPAFEFCDEFDPTANNCAAFNPSGADIEVTATFECEAGKVCPPPAPEEFALEVTDSGNGSGTVECSINSGPLGPCPTEVEEGKDVEVIATPDTGSEPAVLSGTGSAGGCVASPCTFEMTEESSVNAEFNLETFALTLNPIGNGTLSAECNGGACASLTEIPYGTEVDVTAAPESIEYVLASLTGSGSAAGKCNLGSEACSFDMEANSEVVAEFVGANFIASDTANVHGEVPQTTTLESECGDVDLGTFEPNLQHDETYAKTCGLVVTSTGAASALTAEDKTGEAVGRLGHLVQPSYALDEPLETMATDDDALGGTSGTGGALAPLTSPVTLLTWGVPVNFDHVTLEFSQLIKQHDPLHTGEYAKTITLTLQQTAA